MLPQGKKPNAFLRLPELQMTNSEDGHQARGCQIVNDFFNFFFFFPSIIFFSFIWSTILIFCKIWIFQMLRTIIYWFFRYKTTGSSTTTCCLFVDIIKIRQKFLFQRNSSKNPKRYTIPVYGNLERFAIFAAFRFVASGRPRISGTLEVEYRTLSDALPVLRRFERENCNGDQIVGSWLKGFLLENHEMGCRIHLWGSYIYDVFLKDFISINMIC